MENIGIKITTDAETVKVAVDGIMQILNARIDNDTMRAALNVLGKSASIDYATISDCSITVNPVADKPLECDEGSE